MLLIANAQYRVLKSDSMLLGTVEKLDKAIKRMGSDELCLKILPPVRSLTRMKKLYYPWSIKFRKIVTEDSEGKQRCICHDYMRCIVIAILSCL